METVLKKYLQSDKESNSSYKYCITKIYDESVAIVYDNNLEDKMSVTNDIENISKNLGFDKIIYFDSMGQWDFWSKTEGFKTLAKDGKPTRSMLQAINIAKKRYFK